MWIVDSGCSKHITGDRTLLNNFVEKFMGTVRFGNDYFAAITGYGDYVQGNITVYLLCTKDKTLEIIKNFIAQVQLNYNAKVYKIHTDNGMEFKKATLKAHYDKLGIMQQFLIARTPQQNGVVKRRNSILVESIIQTRCNKTPYELLHGRKPNMEYFYVFGSLCYPTNDQDNFGKIKPKANIGIFIGNSETSRGFEIHNRRTKKIMETIHVKFDELTTMSSEHDSLEPVFQRFNNNDPSADSMNIPSKEDLDNLFGPMNEEYFENRSFEMSINSAAQHVHDHEDLPSTSVSLKICRVIRNYTS
nr:hypothetical protein [Tanacetum cinerariifolium]